MWLTVQHPSHLFSIHNKAVHRAYAKRAMMKIPSLEDYEQKAVTETNGNAETPPT